MLLLSGQAHHMWRVETGGIRQCLQRNADPSGSAYMERQVASGSAYSRIQVPQAVPIWADRVQAVPIGGDSAHKR